MAHSFDKIAVIGAGTMGCQLAALFAGAGSRVELLSVTGSGQGTQKRLAGFRPPALFAKRDAERIRAGSLSEHAERLAGCGWIVESVIEELGAKIAVLGAVEAAADRSAIVSSNTSSISYASLAAGMGAGLRSRFLITHFFNPPRYLKLVEICCAAVSEGAAAEIEPFLSGRLGKGVVRVKDTPGFIANRIGVFSVMDAMHLAADRGWPVEAVDTVMGRPAARPRQGVFRMLDMVGLDTVAAVSRQLAIACCEDDLARPFDVPRFLSEMLSRGWRGAKSGSGFYSNAAGTAHAIDLRTVAYRPRLNFCPGSLAEIEGVPDPSERIARTAFACDQAGEIAWPSISRTLAYAASRAEEIADDIASVDRALRWGFGWELGPFEAWDALGARRVAERLDSEGVQVPALVDRLLSSGRGSFYSHSDGMRFVFDVKGGADARAHEERPLSVSRARRSGGVIESNASASLVDLGEGVYCCEFHTKMNALDEGSVGMISLSVERSEREAAALIVANEGEAFSAGADLKLIGSLAERGDFAKLERLVSLFQSACQRVRFSKRPVVAVPFGRVLGGGLEVCLAAAARVAHAETYAGLAELMVGLIPSGGGCKNMLIAMEAREESTREGRLMPAGAPRDGGPQPKSRAAFELIGTARVSSSARDAVGLGYLAGSDRIVMDRDCLIAQARDEAMRLSVNYEPPRFRDDISLPGRGGEIALMQIARNYRACGLATDYDLVVAGRLARVLTGGVLPMRHLATEDAIMELEREAFLSLAGEKRTQERIAHMLKTRKPLRN
ncbi:MAG: 3-hydroxyacyl-CoA dehydrogenase/enoyl-CoA hydratase family protein [Proteobacteria bacterium]|nr:3-hydroxyacyl-CoA dehydrogenase/enoyl-CoA hydratase family protein [Pseudomonadota bacterium]